MAWDVWRAMIRTRALQGLAVGGALLGIASCGGSDRDDHDCDRGSACMNGGNAGAAGAGAAGQAGGGGGSSAGRGGRAGEGGSSAGRDDVAGKGGDVSAGGGGDSGESGAVGGAPNGAGGAEGGASWGGHDGGSENTGGAGEGAGSAGMAGSGAAAPAAVLILLDRSSSMFDASGGSEAPWDLVEEALLASEDGVVGEFQDEVEFGFATFSGLGITEETDPACADIATLAFAPENRDAIADQFTLVTPTPGIYPLWVTPTGHAVNRVRTLFDAYTGAGRKYLLLLTDGHPDTCAVTNPKCGQDLSIKAVQDARAASITTLVLGFGTLVQVNTGCPTSARCGNEHLQDLANAGVGLGVTPPGEAYQYERCVEKAGGLQATYTTGGNSPFYGGATSDELKAELRAMLTRIVEDSIR